MEPREPSKSASKLSELIQKAIDDGVVTNAEFDQIMKLAEEDGVIDAEERSLLHELQDMIADKTVKRVP
jgi:hypothetical protein